MADAERGPQRRDPNHPDGPPSYSVEPDSEQPASSRSDFVPRFVTEVVILLIGLFIGFFWSQYSREVSPDAHIIIALLIVIMVLTRLIYYITRSR